MRGAVTRVIAPWGTKVFLSVSDAQRESLRFHLDSARRFPFGSARRVLHLHIARSIAGSEECDDAPSRRRSVRSTSNHPNFAEHRNATRRAA